jgi:UDP-N-acetylglucosamine--N-acetylmuramyl-(pentapeptide) pyrophosphoryl-undecaprenol N-acetylglucosamine transferase
MQQKKKKQKLKQMQNQSSKRYRLLISGGGTGGHVFPAIAIADAIKATEIDIDFLFVGAEGKLEMDKVPKAGYQIVGLPVMGFPRKPSLKIFEFFVRLLNSMLKAGKILKEFKPQCVVGVGGYASGPVLRLATRRKIPTLIQEQNSYAGVTNRLLASRVNRICVAYEGMDKYFPAWKIIITGNPVRRDILQIKNKNPEAFQLLKLDPGKKTILVLGGSLGAGTINSSILEGIDKLDGNCQLLWQCGKMYYESLRNAIDPAKYTNVFLLAFIDRMDLAYSAADLIISRAGAITISELELIGKPCVLVPSPNVAEDHQTKNAMALVSKQAAWIVKDADAHLELMNKALALLNDEAECSRISENLKKMGIPNAAEKIAAEVIDLMKHPGNGSY